MSGSVASAPHRSDFFGYERCKRALVGVDHVGHATNRCAAR
jgi:hypothetical protein